MDTPFETATSAAASQAGLQLSRLLGSGRHGMVFLGVRDDGEVKSPVAVKVPNLPDGLDNELKALRSFAHPHVVRVIEGPLSNGAIVLEYCDQGTVADRLHEAALDCGEVASLLSSVLPAVDEIHQQGWIHGDISPSNIGLRSVGGPALLDFATARPSDGSAVDEGTAEFAGPLRQADPRLDIRALAATALRALGRPDRWDLQKRHTREALAEIVVRCDTGQPVELHELSTIASLVTNTIAVGDTPHHSLVDGPDAIPTRAFGPPPRSDQPNDPIEPSSRTNAFVLFTALTVVCLVAAAIEFVGVRGENGHGEHLDPKISLAREQSANATLELASATWNTESGVVAIQQADTSLAHFAAGQAGDIAAIADWSCDGVATLGIFRPSTGNWFEFDTWDERASATPTTLDGGSFLWVSTDEDGCAAAVLR